MEDSDPSIAKLDDGSLQFQSYQSARDNSPTTITFADIRLNVGEHGDPKPQSMRRDGYIDPVESARDKIRAWPEIVRKETTSLYVSV